jgi:peptidoglycan hydrolase-like protein with peptidoglycan-binding domain
MPVVLLSSHWSANARIQRAANNNQPMRQNETNHDAVKLLQQALIQSHFGVKAADGVFGPLTAAAVIAAEKHFGFTTDTGIAGREVISALDLSLRGWVPPAGQHWGGLIAKTIVPLAQRKIRPALDALNDVRTMLTVGGGFDFVTADGVTMSALKTHFKLVPPGGTKLGAEQFITLPTIDPLIANFRGIQRTLSNANMIRHSICTNGLDTAAEAPLGGPMLFGPPYSDFKFDPVNVTNIDKTGPNSLAAMMIHEAVHVIDSISGNDATHISEFTVEYETQSAANARHNPSSYATFAAHIHDGTDRPRQQRFGLGFGRPF